MTSGRGALPTWRLIVGAPIDAGAAVTAAKVDGFHTRLIDGRRLRTADEAFEQFAAAFQFPWYFGGNWHAFDECFGELGQQDVGAGIVIVVKNGEAVLSGDSRALADLVTSLGYAGAEWAESRAVADFRVVVQIDEAVEEAAAAWRSAGAAFSGPEPEAS